MSAELTELSGLELAARIAAREVSPVEVVRAVYERLDATEPAWNCFVLRIPERALAEAQAAEREIAAGNYRGPLHGLPLAVKDNIAVADTVTAAGAKFLHDNYTPDDAEAVRRLAAAGAIVVGKTNLHELAMGSSTDNPWYGPTRNPWDTAYIPGGSSGGTAAAVVGGQVPLGLGTDSAGSVRMPASVSGCVGLKATHGRVGMRGLVASLTVTTDHIGPMTRTVADAALMLQAMAGYDPHDPFSIDRPVPDYRAALGRDLKGVRVGVPTNFFFDLMDPEVETGVRAAIRELAGLGAELVEVEIPDLETLMQARAGLGGEALAFVTPYLRSRPEQFSEPLRLRLLAAHFLLAGDYARANRVRRIVMERFADVFHTVDLLAAPATIVPAYPIGAETLTVRDYRTGQDVEMGTTHILIRNTATGNMTGLPSISVPAGFTARGLPIGLMLTGRPFDEELVLAAAHAYEQATSWHTRRPAEPAVAAG
ncbi:MAG TPA: amidase [Chloroflexota bacterium]|jgi:aspartyl-tRNA(Asn)/glutamyl-tRNA(Gln) amidotransferase subunit A